MRAVDYALREAWASLWRSRGATAFAVTAIALAMVVLGTLLLLTWNVQRLVDQWTSAAEFSVYLREDATSEQRGAIEAAIDESRVALARQYVSKSQALARFRTEFSELASLTAGFEENPFPASLEVRVQAAAERDGRAEALARRLALMAGVADVRHDREWLARIAAALQAVRGAGLALAMLMAAAAGLTVAAVVRLGLQSRHDEIEIMRLVGSPLSFIRGPFVAEGLLQGGVGALGAIVVLWLGFATANATWGADASVLLDGGALQFLPIRFWVELVGGGMAVGGLGGFAASRHAARGQWR